MYFCTVFVVSPLSPLEPGTSACHYPVEMLYLKRFKRLHVAVVSWNNLFCINVRCACRNVYLLIVFISSPLANVLLIIMLNC